MLTGDAKTRSPGPADLRTSTSLLPHGLPILALLAISSRQSINYWVVCLAVDSSRLELWSDPENRVSLENPSALPSSVRSSPSPCLPLSSGRRPSATFAGPPTRSLRSSGHSLSVAWAPSHWSACPRSAAHLVTLTRSLFPCPIPVRMAQELHTSTQAIVTALND